MGSDFKKKFAEIGICESHALGNAQNALPKRTQNKFNQK